MKKNLLLLLFLSLGFFLRAQEINRVAALHVVTKNAMLARLTDGDLQNVIISNAYHDHSTGLDMVYLQQSFKQLPVYNQIQVLAFKAGKLVSNTGGRITNIEKLTENAGALPSIAASKAVITAINFKKISSPQLLSGFDIIPGKKSNFGKAGIAHEDITAELMWVPVNDGKKVQLAWQVFLAPLTSSDYWMIRVDAKNNKVIDENNLTVYCGWNPSQKKMFTNLLAPQPVVEKKADLSNLFAPDFLQNKQMLTYNSPALVNGASYRVVKYPAESPLHPGGTPQLVTNPWTAAPGNATSLKWHSNGITDYNITRGNNVWAKEDHASSNGNGGAPATSTTPDPLTFDFTPDFLKQPNQTTPAPNQQFNITNLFYWVNIYHDILYQYGFDEPGGNFQDNNQGRGGAGNDFVFADAQDGNFGDLAHQDNANFSTPADGGNGRMQMFLWDTAVLNVNSPSVVAGPYAARESNFSTANKLNNVGPVTADVVYYNDDAGGTTHEACAAPANSIAGKIALIDRGTCTFIIKVKNAQLAGAVGAIVVNNVATPPLIIMAGDDNTITIPAVSITQADGLILKAQLASNVNATLFSAMRDGDVDNSIITHEHSHGLSNRLTGGPAQAGCLANAEQMGEGWSDYYALMLTQDWAGSNLNTGFTSHRGIGTYVFQELPSGPGIRTFPYTTDITVNTWTYDQLATNTAFPPNYPIAGEPHLVGEIWCATLWDMTWDIINQVGSISPNLYDATGAGGNTIAMKLVTQGLKLQPCSPGFIDGRNAIIRADSLLYGGAHACVIREAFRRRGMGDNASQGSSNNAADQVADFAPINCLSCTDVAAVTQPANTIACTGTSATFTVTVSGTNPTYQWQVSTNGGTTYTPISGATSATLTITGVTAAMSGYLYQVIISNTCPSTVTSSPATLTVNDPAAITTQPVSATVCAGANASFTVTATGTTNTYQWQVSTDGGVTFTDIPGATTPTLSLPAVTTAQNGNQYHLVISSCGPAGLNSSNVTLTVNAPVSISVQPANTTACTGGGDATFTVTAAGTGNTYQWQVSTNGGTTFTDIPGATSATLTLTGVTAAMDNNIYHVVITNSCTPAAVTSANATLTITDNAVITTQPVSAVVCEGADAIFTASASGVSFQWQVSTDGVTFTDIAGATTTTLTIPAVTPALNGHQYQLVIASCGGTFISTNHVTLTVTALATISTQPVNATVCDGADATFSVNAGGSSVTYQWSVSTDGGTTYTPITGATTSTLTLTGVTTALNNNLYQVTVSNSCTPGLASTAASLTVNPASSITTQPASTVACEGSSATFSIEIANTTPGATYQWQVSTDAGVTFTDINGANSPTLTLTAVTASMNNNSYLVIVNACGTLTSDTVVLTVNSLPTVVITASPYNSLTSGLSTTLTATSTPPATSFSWFKDNVLVPGVTGSTIEVTHDQLGEYTASVTDVNGCSNKSNPLSITDSVLHIAFISPNPNGGQFDVRFDGTGLNGQPRIITMYDAKGARVFSQSYVTSVAYERMRVNAGKLSRGVYVLILSDVAGNTLGTGKVVIR